MAEKECLRCIHYPVCKTAESCDGYVSGCEHFKEQKQVRMDVMEKLVELIENAESQRLSVALCCTTDALIDLPSKEEYIAEYLVANGVTVQSDKDINVPTKWISVKDRLPENDYGKHWKERKYYLVRFAPSGLMCVAHYGYKEYDWWIDEHDCVLSATNFKEVTHWMGINNLPQPPKGE